MTLHAAIEQVLHDNLNIWMTAAKIAQEIADGELYFRADGDSPPASQIHARINQYLQLFEVDKSQSPMRFRLR